ncbi:XRE family transcriptional regulator [Bacillus sp. LL01]|uniref:helix-turn-helix domain-containing protein n=1 Tax=Bacillus sp. LL01 TaxID=1665556 RepID=UPI00064D6699|nr:helix-turn-helix domain-containing protein [Bacillus sp. LL01]KMJ58102.1 XRE family transcriptional regulator [Bacillus sp. LL01]
MLGLGKRRSKFGKWMDREGISQIELEEEARLSRGTVSRLCNDDDYEPKHDTIAKINKGLAKLGKKLPDRYFGC